jgi:hypothetical protein
VGRRWGSGISPVNSHGCLGTPAWSPPIKLPVWKGERPRESKQFRESGLAGTLALPDGLSIFVVSVGERGFNRSWQLTATELSGHNQCKEMKRREFLTTTMVASVN